MAKSTGQERTEQPTTKRMNKARKEGQIAQSKELCSAFTLITLLLMLCLFGPTLLRFFLSQLRQGLSCRYDVMAETGGFAVFFNEIVIKSILVTCPVFLALVVAGIAGSIALSGWNYSPKAIKLKFDVLNPVSGLKKLVSVRSLITLILSILKLVFVGSIVYFYLRDKLEALVVLRWAWSMQILAQIAGLIVGVVLRICIAVFILAVADAIYQRWKWKDDLKMTKQEKKDERKQEEGSPQVKRRIRQAQFELFRKRMLQEVPKASVVLVNPTHVAVALQYDNETMDAPVVVAKGADYLSEKIREIARAYGVPIIRRPELARTIYSTVEVGQPIPESLFVAVAEVLAMIYRLSHKK